MRVISNTVLVLSLFLLSIEVNGFSTSSPSSPDFFLKRRNNAIRISNRNPSECYRYSYKYRYSPPIRSSITGDELNGNTINDNNNEKLDDDDLYLQEQRRQLLDDFNPRTQSLTQSMLYFVRYIKNNMELNQIKKQEGREKQLSNNETDSKSTVRRKLSKLKKSITEILHLVGYNKAILIPSFTFLILGSLFTSVVPHFYSKSIICIASCTTASSTALMQNEQTAVLLRNLGGLGVFSILMGLTTGLRGSCFWIAGSRANYNVRTKLYRTLLRQETAFFDRTETGKLISRLNNDVNKIGNVVSFHVNIILRQIIQFIFGSMYLFKVSPSLTLFAYSGIGIIGYVSKLYADFARILAENVQNVLADGSAVAETSLSMSETVRAFDGLDVETERYEMAQSKALQLEEVQAWAYGTHKFFLDSLQSGMQVALLFACWVLGQKGSLDAAKLTTFLFYVNFVLESINGVGDQWAKIQSAVGASSSVFHLIRRIPQIMDPLLPSSTNSVMNSTNISSKPKPVIHMKNMTISYDEMDSNNPALNNINLQIYPNDKIAIVGRSGSGKSSMLRTLLRFYDPSSGQCEIDGKALTDYSRKQISNKVVIVQQEPRLFPMTLLENVLYGIDQIDGTYNQTMRVRVTEALELSGLALGGPQNTDLTLDTRVGEGGRTLSGGQRQRVAIARALVRQPDILLLDEPSAALDSKSENTVIMALKQAMERTRCMIMVTHRFAPIRSLGVNKLIVLDHGKISEMGHPEDLLRLDGLYAQMAREQGIIAIESREEDLATALIEDGDYVKQS